MTKKIEKVFTHQAVGSVFNIKLTEEGAFAQILCQRPEEGKSDISLGDFVVLTTEDSDRVLLCSVMDQQPDFDEGLGISVKSAMRHSIDSNVSLDKAAKEQLLYLIFRCKVLGICDVSADKKIKFYSNLRSNPAEHTLKAAVPCPEFMRQLFLTAIGDHDGDMEPVVFNLGNLQYGTHPDYTAKYDAKDPEKCVPVYFNASNILRKRTAIFGKSGYGKSNAVKAVVGMIASTYDKCGQLILDTNGEYGFSNAQNDGMADIFDAAGMKNKVVVYTQRKYSTAKQQKFTIKGLKFDVFDHIGPAIEIVDAEIKNRGDIEPLYMGPWISEAKGVDNRADLFKETKNASLIFAIWYASLMKAGLYPSEDKRHNGSPLVLKKEFIQYLAEKSRGNNGDNKVQADQESKSLDGVLAGDLISDPIVKEILLDKSIMKTERSYVTNDIRTMAEYIDWKYPDKDAKKESSQKRFLELLDNNRRLYNLRNFHLSEGEKNNKSLAQSINEDLAEGKLVVLDLASVSIDISKALANHILNYTLDQASKLFADTSKINLYREKDTLIYMEEAQNYLNPELIRSGSIYERIAKEGRKFNIGLVYITQQPSAVDTTITSQTENIIALHMSNDQDCKTLNKIKDKFDAMTCRFIKDEAKKGLAYVYCEPHQPFVLPCQIHKFDKELILANMANRKKK